jgi:fatty acid desaturase
MSIPEVRAPSEKPPLTRALARRERHRQRPLAVRALPFVAVGILVAASVAAFLRLGFLPPLVAPAIVALLALEFVWAARLLAWGIGRVTRVARGLKRIATA